jgi:hypothetical protein
MEWQQLIVDFFLRTSQELERVLNGLTVDELNQIPRPDCNSIGWLCWHLTRSCDRNLSELTKRKQLWIKDEWHARFNRPPDPADTGFGHSSKEVTAFKSPDGEIVLAYHRAVVALAKQYITNNLSETDLKRKTRSPTLKNVATVRKRMLGVISEGLQHVGQTAYVRSLLRGKGWRE